MPMTEVFQYVRGQYESKPPPRKEVGPGHAKVVARDEKWFITELPDKWKQDYERRKRHRHTGYFAYNHVPYKTFANLRHTDVYDLLGDHLGILMNKHYAFMQFYSRNQPGAAEDMVLLNSPEPHNTIVVVCDEADKQSKLLPPSKNGGLTAIRTTLNSDGRVLRDVAAGSPLKTALVNEKVREQDSLKDTRTPNKAKQEASSSVCCFIRHEECSTAAAHVNSEESERCHSGKCLQKNVADDTTHPSNGIKTVVGPNLYVALAAAHFKNHTSSSANKPGLHLVKESITAKRHQQRHSMAKLKSVYAVLCCLYNIKSRDLRNQEALSYSTIKALATKPLHLLNKNQPHLHQHHLHVEVHHHPSSSGPQLPHTAAGGQHRGAMIASRHVKLDGPESAATAAVETWEELVHVHRESEKQSSSPAVCHTDTAGSTPAADTARRPLRTGSGTCTHTHQKSHKVLPPWQQQVLFVKNKKESLKRDPAQKLQDCIDSFCYFRSEMSQHVKATFDDREYQLQKHLLNKMEYLVLGANMDVCLEKMRGQAYLIQKEERAEERSKPPWFLLLEKEVKMTFGVQDKEASVMIEKLKQFVHVDIDAIPHVMEKMCLLIMSLPASQLSIQPVMSAIEHVLEHVLKRSPKLLSQLKNLRQLPPITLELQSAPVYIFGYRI